MKVRQFTQFSIFMLIIISLFTMACNKEKGGVSPNVLRKVNKVTSSDGTVTSYTYDAQGRRIRVDYKDSYVTTIYNGNIVTETTTYIDPTKSAPIRRYTLDAKGFAYLMNYTSGTNDYQTEFEHNNDGRLTKITQKSKLTGTTGPLQTSVTYSYAFDSDGDIKSTEGFYATGSNFNYVIQHTIDKTHYSTIGTEFTGLDWYNRSSVHVITKSDKTLGNGNKETVNYSTTYDSKGYVLSQTITTTTATGLTTLTNNYTYK